MGAEERQTIGILVVFAVLFLLMALRGPSGFSYPDGGPDLEDIYPL